MKKASAINKDTVQKYNNLNKELGALETQITNRVAYIYHTIFKTVFKKKSDYCFYVYGAAEGEVGNISNAIDGDVCSFMVEQYQSGDFSCPVLLGKDEWDLRDAFPAKWLYEDFEEELRAGKEAYDAIKEQDEIKQQEKKTKSKELVKKAKSKLTKEELKAIRAEL